MAKAEFSVEKLVHNAIADTLQHIADTHEVKVESISVEWLECDPITDAPVFTVHSTNINSTVIRRKM